MELAIYFKTADVAYFKEVSGFQESKEEIMFKYFGQASQRYRTAKFRIDSISGWSLTDD